MYELRWYQERAINALRSLVRQGKRAPLLVAPCGAGKTAIGATIATSAAGNGRRVLWLTHLQELIDQTVASLHRCGVERVSVLRADDDRFDAEAQIVVASVQTLNARSARPHADIVVLDEARHYRSNVWGAVADDYANAIRIGLDATPERSDGTPLGDLFDSLVVAATYSELLREQHLVPCEVIAPAERLRGAVAQRPWEAYQAHGDGRPAVVFCATVAEAVECTQHLDSCRVIHGTMRSDERAQVVADFAAGKFNALSNCGILLEGFDAPRVEVCVLGRGCTHASTYIQICGRVLRPYPGKTSALLIDLTGCIHEHGWPTEDRVYSLTGTAIARERGSVSRLWQCHGCGLVTVSPPADRCCSRCGTALPPPKRPKLKPSELAHATWTCECGHEHRTIPVNCPMCGRLSSRGRRVAAETDDQRQAYLAKLQAEAAEKGYKTGWIWHRYRAKYGSAA